MIIIPETNVQDLKEVAEKLRQLVYGMSCEIIPHLSCSFGVSILNKKSDSIETFIDKSDKAMYKAKAMGKNRAEFL